ncbi:MAG: heme-binding protein [Deltaproteobacteria bacterium]|nr:MAG: heme-binding protein [Deltaproteobacteria bacterium]
MKSNLDLALDLIAAARKKAEQIGVPMVIAVVDNGGNLVALQRMDQALLVSVDIAHNKAYTAAAVKLPTHELATLAQPGRPLFGIHNADGGRIVIFGGGFPLKLNNEIIGGIGVSGGSVEEDIQCAEAALERLISGART